MLVGRKEDGSLTHVSGRNHKSKMALQRKTVPTWDAPVVSMINIFVSAPITTRPLHYVTEVIYQMLLWNHTITGRFWALSL